MLAELRLRGFATVEEPGRRIVRQELAGDGAALPWIDAEKFARRAIAMALTDIAAASAYGGWVFFDRGLIDAAVALERVCGEPARITISGHRFHGRVFLAPPWPEIYVTDAERPHGFRAALKEYEHLLDAYPRLGYELIVLPKVGVAERADFMVQRLSSPC